MKILKYILLFLLLLMVLFFLGGLIKSSVNYGHEITVDKSAKEAWMVHQDQSKFTQWLKGFKSIELLKGEQGAIGSQYKVTVKPSPEQPEFVMTETIVDKKDFEFIDFRFDSDLMVFNQKTTFTESGGKTKIKTHSNVVGSSLVNKSLFAWMEILTGTFQKQEEENINNLQKVINQNSRDYFPPKPLDSIDTGK